MKRLLAMLLTLLMLLSFATVSFASEKVLTPAEAEIKAGSGVYVSGGRRWSFRKRTHRL